MKNYYRSSIHKKTTALIVIAVLFALIIGGVKWYCAREKRNAYNIKPVSSEQIGTIVDDKKAKKLMIVAHPDDEVLWGGAHLMTKDYLVVCITDGRNKVRSKEFADVMTASGNSFLMLEYPDKVGGRRDNWSEVSYQLSKDLEKIIKCKDWELIVTHNKHGEYGHQHHKMSHSIVTEIYDRNHLTEPLYNFGRYYRAVDIADHKKDLVSISNEEYDYKYKICHMYTSQLTVVKNLWHMAPYEMWTQYNHYTEFPQYEQS